MERHRHRESITPGAQVRCGSVQLEVVRDYERGGGLGLLLV